MVILMIGGVGRRLKRIETARARHIQNQRSTEYSHRQDPASLRRGNDKSTDGETTQPQRFGAHTCHQIRCLAAGAAYAVCPQLAAASAATALRAYCLRTSFTARMCGARISRHDRSPLHHRDRRPCPRTVCTIRTPKTDESARLAPWPVTLRRCRCRGRRGTTVILAVATAAHVQ